MEQFLNRMTTTWWGITLLCIVAVAIWFTISAIFYRQFFKRFYDIVFSVVILIILSPIILILIVIGAINMKGNPFFVQPRIGKNEKEFKLIKFRTMKKGEDGGDNITLSDEKRLTRYGKFLRATSLDEILELINIFKGDMSIVGPRPLLVKYLPLYNEEQRKRHNVLPGLTGKAQVNGRNALPWNDRFKLDVEYVNNVSLMGDIAILLKTVPSVLKKDGISSQTSSTMEEFQGNSVENN